MKNHILFSLTIVFLANCIIFAQPKPKPVVEEIPAVEEIIIQDDANNFSTKGLPEPMFYGSNPSNTHAAELAKAISAYDENSMRVLMTAIQKTGFYILDEKQKVLYQPTYGKGMGLAFYDFEVAGMYKTSRAGAVTTYAKLGELLQKSNPKIPKGKMAEMMLADLRSAVTSKNAEIRFWASLIIEIGKNFPTPVNLMTATPENATINIIQASLIERRLVGDFIAIATQQASLSRPNNLNLAQIFRPKNEQISFLNASYNRKIVGEPCNYSEVETVSVDQKSFVATTVHGKALEFLLESWGVAEKAVGTVGTVIGGTSMILSWLKLVASASKIKGKIDVEQPVPLVRTKSSKVSGEKRLLTGKFEIEITDLRNVNCFRLALNSTTGIDFSMPSSGPLAEKPVGWTLLGEVSFKGQNSSKTGAYDQVVMLSSPDGGDYTKLETNANGESRLQLEGGKQKEDLTNLPVYPVTKYALVRADVALKSMKDTKQEATDIGTFAAGIAIAGGSVSGIGLITAIPEIANRMKIPAASVLVPIRDWQRLSRDWSGYFHVKYSQSRTEIIKASRESNGNSSGEGFRKFKNEGQMFIELNPRTDEEIENKAPEKPAKITLSGFTLEHEELNSEDNPCCVNLDGNYYVRIKKGNETTFSDSFLSKKFDFRVKTMGLESFGTQSFDIKAKRRIYEQVDSNCDANRGEAKDETEEIMTAFNSFSLPNGNYGGHSAGNGRELVGGEKVINRPDGSTITIKWMLTRRYD